MATTLQPNPISLQQQQQQQPNKNHDDDDDENVALATILANSLRFEQQSNNNTHIRPQQQQMFSRPPRQRTTTNNSSSSSIHHSQQQQVMQKSTSTPNRRKQPHPSYKSSLPNTQTTNINNDRRKSAPINFAVPQDRRPSFTGSVTSNISITSDMSVNTKLSLTKRLRKVFSMSNLRTSSSDLSSLAERNGSNTSIASTTTVKKRRSLSTLFQKSSSSQEKEEVKKPNNPIQQKKVRPESSEEEGGGRVSLGLHYGLGVNQSPGLRPTIASTSSSTSSLVMNTTDKRRVQFNKLIQVNETFAVGDYDRRCDSNATCQKLTPMLAMKIKQELNEYKLTEMHVHVDSRQYTQFFL